MDALVTVAQHCFYFCCHWLFTILFRPEIRGLEYIPQKPFILAANHTARVDPFLVCLLPFSIVKHLMPISFATAEWYYRKWYLHPFLVTLGCFPVMERAWTLEEFSQTTLQKLQEGKVVMYFPEGRIVRGNEKAKAKPGIGYIAELSQKPILPLRIQWDRSNSPFPKLTLAFGETLSFSKDAKADIASYRQKAETIMNVVHSL